MTPVSTPVFLVDGQSYIYRAFYAVRDLTTAQGFPTNAIFGFVNMLQRIHAEHAPSHLGMVFDAPGKNFRHELYPEYKANRTKMPDELRVQIPRIKDIVQAYNIPILELAGYEADDIIATLATRWERDGVALVIVSGDKDLMQLVSERVSMLDTMRDRHIGPAEVQAKFGVEPGRVVEVQALMGDATDNIPGIPGVGEKTAIKLITQWQNLDSVLQHAAEIKGKLGQRIREHAALARLSKTLATLRLDVPLTPALEDLALTEPDHERLRELFTEFEFRRFLGRSGLKLGVLPWLTNAPRRRNQPVPTRPCAAGPSSTRSSLVFRPPKPIVSIRKRRRSTRSMRNWLVCRWRPMSGRPGIFRLRTARTMPPLTYRSTRRSPYSAGFLPIPR